MTDSPAEKPRFILSTINYSLSTFAISGLPRIRTEFSPVKSRDFTVKVCNPDATRWTTSPLRAYYRHQYEHQHHAFPGEVSASRRFALRYRRTPWHSPRAMRARVSLPLSRRPDHPRAAHPPADQFAGNPAGMA